MTRLSANTLKQALQSLDPETRDTLESQWNSIDWKYHSEVVNKLQTRIAKATKTDNWKEVKQLQRLLTRSFSAKALAVKTTVTNSGKNTPGIDGMLWTTKSAKMLAIKHLCTSNYKAKPLKRVEIDKGKGDGSTRPLGIPTMYDRAIQKLWEIALSPVAETNGDTVSFGFRKYRSAQDAREHIFNFLASSQNAQWVLDADIKGFFDNLSHEWLMNNIPMDKKVLKEILKSGVVINGKLHPTEKGTPQGGIISPTLANMALDGLEKVLKDEYWRVRYGQFAPKHLQGTYSDYSHKRNKKKVHLTRYADDFIISGIDKETCEEVRELITPFLTERGVELSETKTKIVHINEGFDFLGWNFKKYNGKLLTKPSNKSYKKLMENIRQVTKELATSRQDTYIRKLNMKIRGWRNYHKSSVARKIFEKADHEIWQITWGWAAKRHRMKGKKWVKERYYHKYGGNNWAFYDDSRPIGQNNQVLIRMANTKITRHPKPKLDKNPYLDREYFIKRNLTIGARNLSGKFKNIWKSQEGKCPYCNKAISIDEPDNYTVHHITPKAWGGSDKPSNLIYMHTECHRMYHSNNGVVRKTNNKMREYVKAYKPIKQNLDWKSLITSIS